MRIFPNFVKAVNLRNSINSPANKQTNQKIVAKTTPRDTITKLIKITVKSKILKWNFVAEQQVMWSPSLVRAGALAAPMWDCNASAQHQLAVHQGRIIVEENAPTDTSQAYGRSREILLRKTKKLDSFCHLNSTTYSYNNCFKNLLLNLSSMSYECHIYLGQFQLT